MKLASPWGDRQFTYPLIGFFIFTLGGWLSTPPYRGILLFVALLCAGNAIGRMLYLLRNRNRSH